MLGFPFLSRFKEFLTHVQMCENPTGLEDTHLGTSSEPFPTKPKDPTPQPKNKMQLENLPKPFQAFLRLETHKNLSTHTYISSSSLPQKDSTQTTSSLFNRVSLLPLLPCASALQGGFHLRPHVTLLEARIGPGGVGRLVPGHMKSQVETMANANFEPQVIQMATGNPQSGGKSMGNPQSLPESKN